MVSIQYKYSSVNPLRKEWCTLLNRYKWTYFVTLTFKDFPKTYTAINRVKRFLRYVEGTVKHKIGFYTAMEYTKLGCPHFHLLIGNVDGVKYSILHKWWYTKYGLTRFEVYDPEKGAVHYLTKYVVKTDGWYQLKGVDTLKLI